MAKLKWNIVMFNITVKRIEMTLHQHGSGAPDLLFQLSSAYLTCPDKTFMSYIQANSLAHEDGTKPLTAEGLMHCSQLKYGRRQLENRTRLHMVSVTIVVCKTFRGIVLCSAATTMSDDPGSIEYTNGDGEFRSLLPQSSSWQFYSHHLAPFPRVPSQKHNHQCVLKGNCYSVL